MALMKKECIRTSEKDTKIAQNQEYGDVARQTIL